MLEISTADLGLSSPVRPDGLGADKIGNVSPKNLFLVYSYITEVNSEGKPCETKHMNVTCAEHRESLLLLALRRRLTEEEFCEEERMRLEAEAARLEAKLDMA